MQETAPLCAVFLFVMRPALLLIGSQGVSLMMRYRGIKIDVKDLADSLALPWNNNSEELRFRQTSSRVLERCAQTNIAAFSLLHIFHR